VSKVAEGWLGVGGGWGGPVGEVVEDCGGGGS